MNATARLIAMCCVAAFPALSSAALATEVPPEVSAASLLRGNEKGPNYTVLSPVQSDGLMRIFRVETPFGTYRVQGDAQLKTRIRELAAVRRLETMKASDTFVKSLGQAAAAPLKYGADLITDPKETLTRSVSGIANMFDRIGAGVRNQGASRDNVATSLLGIDTARRHLAVELGVDPYSDFPPLQKQLEDVATAAGLGGLSIQALTMAIPGGAGVAVSSVASANTFADTLKQKTSAQIIDQVSATLKRLGVPDATVVDFVRNRSYSPADLLAISMALQQLNAKRSSIFIAKAADARSADEGAFQTQRAVAIARNSAILGGIRSFVDVGGFPLNLTANGRLVAVFPLDELAWTDRVEGMVTRLDAARPKDGPAPILSTNAAITPMAAAELTKLGWTHQMLAP